MENLLYLLLTQFNKRFLLRAPDFQDINLLFSNTYLQEANFNQLFHLISPLSSVRI
jgi:hypothetical protein